MNENWRQLVREKLAPLELPAGREEEVLDELCQLLADYAVENNIDSTSDAKVGEWIQEQIPEWQELADTIREQRRHNTSRLHHQDLPAPGQGKGSVVERLRGETLYALRKLLKEPGFSVAAVLTLGMGIGLNTAVFSLVNGVLFKPLPVADSERLVNIYTTDELNQTMSESPTSYPDFADLREHSESFSGLVGYSPVTIAMETTESSEIVMGELVTGNYFSTLGVFPELGTSFTDADDRPDHGSPVVVLSHSAWQGRFGGDPSIVGRELRINGQLYTVIGVMPADFFGLTRGFNPVAWLPMRTAWALGANNTARMGTATKGINRFADRNPRWVLIVGRLKPESSIVQARLEANALASDLRQAYPETNERRSFSLIPTTLVRVMPSVDATLSSGSLVVMGIVTLILLIACTNIANMLLVRSVSRRKEMATRLALGASRPALIRQLQIESILLAMCGGTLGLALTLLSNRAISSLRLPVMVDVSLDLRVFAFTFAVAALAAVAFGLTPAFVATRVELATVLGGDSRGATGSRARGRLRGALVIGQVALSMLLLIFAGLSLRSMFNAHLVDPGFDPAGAVVCELAPNLQSFAPEQVDRFYDDLAERAGALPNVAAVGFTTGLPLTFYLSSAGVAAEGDTTPPESWPQLGRSLVSADYFAAIGIPVLRGRPFSGEDDMNSPPVAVVNQALASLLWPGEDPLGKRLLVDDGSDVAYQVIGVTPTGKYWTLGEKPRPYLYRCLGQHEAGQRFLVARHSGDPRLVLSAIRQLIRTLDERIAVTGLETLQEAIGVSLLLPRSSALLFGVAGTVGLLLAVFGLYGVIAYGVGQRVREFGIRMALGALPRSILVQAIREAALLTTVGAGFGLIAALASARLLEAVLYGVSATDTVTFVAVPLIFLAVAIVAGMIPARRAVRIDPATALRCE